MENYSYKILSVDPINHQMVVEYSPTTEGLYRISLNITAPEDFDNISEYVNRFAPQDKWEKQKNPSDLSSLVGQTGEVVSGDVSINTVNIYYEMMKASENAFNVEQENTGIL